MEKVFVSASEKTRDFLFLRGLHCISELPAVNQFAIDLLENPKSSRITDRVQPFWGLQGISLFPIIGTDNRGFLTWEELLRKDPYYDFDPFIHDPGLKIHGLTARHVVISNTPFRKAGTMAALPRTARRAELYQLAPETFWQGCFGTTEPGRIMPMLFNEAINQGHSQAPRPQDCQEDSQEDTGGK